MKIFITDDQGNPIKEVKDYDVVFAPKKESLGENRLSDSNPSSLSNQNNQNPLEGPRKNTYKALLVGLFLSLLLITVGFWKTIGVLIILIVAYFIGGALDGNPRVLDVLKKIY